MRVRRKVETFLKWRRERERVVDKCVVQSEQRRFDLRDMTDVCCD